MADTREFYDDVLRRVRSLYGIDSVAIASKVNLVSSGLGYLVQVEGGPDLGPRNPGAEGRSITPDYFSVVGIPLLDGRTFAEHDTSSSGRVMIINQAFARKFFPGQNPLGKHVTYSTDRITCEIVGIVGNVRASIGETSADPEIYLPLSQRPWLVAKLLVRTDRPAVVTSLVRKQIEAADPTQAVAASLPMEQVISNNLSRPRTTIVVVLIFGTAALLLSATGIFGIVAYTVAQRRKEIGIRLALGADAGRIQRLVLRQTFRLLLTGFACGLPLSLLLAPLYRSLLFGVKPNDSTTLFAGVLVLSFAALAASYIPARRAGQVDPVSILRAE